MMKKILLFNLFMLFSVVAFSQGSVRVTAFYDFNGDNNLDSGEGIQGMTFVVRDFFTNAIITGGTTNANGVGISPPVPSGLVNVQLFDGGLTGYQLTTPGGNPQVEFVPTSGNVTAAFGYRCFGTVEGVVFDDINGNGSQDSGEPGLPNEEVTITINDESPPPTNPQTVFTNSDGTWSLSIDAPEGNTEVEVMVASPDYSATTPNPQTQTVNCDQTITYEHGFTQQVLPVELTSFGAEKAGNDVYLTWTTATELNNDYFEVQYSYDGLDYEVAGEIDGHGTTEEEHNYSFTHENMNNRSGEPIFYRLKQIDFGGKTSKYSKVRLLSFEGASNSYKLFPNPVQQGADVGIQSAIEIESVTVYDINGQIVQEFNANEGNYESINTTDLSSGVYFIVVNGDGKPQKLVVQ